MLKAPKFWYLKKDTYLSRIFYPFSFIFRLGTKIRNITSHSNKSLLPVICIGNIVVGGAGKTPVALKIGKILIKTANPSRDSNSMPSQRTNIGAQAILGTI